MELGSCFRILSYAYYIIRLRKRDNRLRNARALIINNATVCGFFMCRQMCNNLRTLLRNNEAMRCLINISKIFFAISPSEI